jgi:hypothetical protein
MCALNNSVLRVLEAESYLFDPQTRCSCRPGEDQAWPRHHLIRWLLVALSRCRAGVVFAKRSPSLVSPQDQCLRPRADQTFVGAAQSGSHRGLATRQLSDRQLVRLHTKQILTLAECFLFLQPTVNRQTSSEATYSASRICHGSACLFMRFWISFTGIIYTMHYNTQSQASIKRLSKHNRTRRPPAPTTTAELRTIHPIQYTLYAVAHGVPLLKNRYRFDDSGLK